MADTNALTQERLKELLNYDASTGVFTWLPRDNNQFNSAFAGKEAGTVKSCEYLRINLGGKIYKAHRLAWLYTYGHFPESEIDHINHDTLDNRLSNLRAVSHAENGKNQSLKKNNTTGISGVNWHSQKQKWHSRINSCKGQLHLGDYNDFFEAVCARKSAENAHNYHINHGA